MLPTPYLMALQRVAAGMANFEGVVSVDFYKCCRVINNKTYIGKDTAKDVIYRLQGGPTFVSSNKNKK